LEEYLSLELEYGELSVKDGQEPTGERPMPHKQAKGKKKPKKKKKKPKKRGAFSRSY